MTEAASRYVTSCVSKELDDTTVGILETTRRFMFSLGYQTSSVYLLTFDAQYEGLEHMEQYMTEEADVVDTFIRVSVSLGPDSVWEEYIASERGQREQWVTDPRTASTRLQAMWDKVERQFHYRRVGYSLNLDDVMRRAIDYLAKLADFYPSGIMVELLTFDFEERKLLIRISNSTQENKGVCIYTEVQWCDSGDLNKE